jgi:hypothetical protein
MKTILILVFLIVIFATPSISDEIVTTKDGKKVLLKDNYIWEYMESLKSTDTINVKYAEEAVTVWDKALLRKDGEYEKQLGLFLHYQNNTDKKIIGVIIKVDILNPFGKIVYNTTYEDEVVLEPNERLKNDKYWVFSDNQFINDEPYDRLWKMADNGTAKINTKILKVIFDNGTILNPKPVTSNKPTNKK